MTTEVPTYPEESLYPVRVAASMTGLKPELLRAWETRYGAIRPGRTDGGSRLYSGADLDRLRLLRDVLAAGHRIGNVAHLDDSDLLALLPEPGPLASDPIQRIIAAAEKLDGAEARRLLADELSRLGSVGFAKDLVLPLLAEIGDRWSRGRLSISVEHLATAILRSILMTLVEPAGRHPGAPKLVFATPSGEPHDLGTLVATLVADRAGADLAFLGADVPVDDLVGTVVEARASAVVLGIVTLAGERAETMLRTIRERLPAHIGVWIGGAGIEGLAPIKGIDRIENLNQLEAHVTQLRLGGASHSAGRARAGGRRT